MRRNLDNFYLYLEGKGYSNHTILNYKKDLEQFLFFAKDIGISQIDYEYIRSYLSFLYNKKYK
jgi:site-specific recombinase XerD